MKLLRAWPIATVAVLAAVALWFTYDIYWWPEDEGYFAHIAQRVAAGEVYGRDVLGVHGGYHVFLNAFLFQLFGSDLVVLRFPLVLLLVVQVALAAQLVRRHGPALMLVAGFIPLTLGYWQFANPSPNWYVLGLATIILWLLTQRERISWAWFSMGVLLGVMLLFRHPSALIVGSGLLSALLLSFPSERLPASSHRWLARGVLGLSVSVSLLLGFLFFEVTAFLLFVIPLWLIIGLLYRAELGWTARHTNAFIGLCLGGTVAVLPMLGYLLYYGVFVEWLRSLVVSGTGLTSGAFFGERSYVGVAFDFVSGMWSAGAPVVAVWHAVYWASLLLVPLALCGVLIRRWCTTGERPAPEAVFALTFGLVSVYYQIPFYLYCSIGLILLMLVRSLRISLVGNVGLVIGLIVLQLTALMYSAFPYALMIPEEFTRSTLPRVDLVLETDVHQEYQALYDVVISNTEPDDTIYVFPFSPDLYFLTDRKNPFQFVGSMLGVTSEATYETFLTDFKNVTPALVLADPESKYYSRFDARFREYLQSTDSGYEFTGIVSGREIYRRSDD